MKPLAPHIQLDDSRTALDPQEGFPHQAHCHNCNDRAVLNANFLCEDCVFESIVLDHFKCKKPIWVFYNYSIYEAVELIPTPVQNDVFYTIRVKELSGIINVRLSEFFLDYGDALLYALKASSDRVLTLTSLLSDYYKSLK